MRRYDAVALFSSTYLGSMVKIFRDGTLVRMGVGGIYPYQKGYDANIDLSMTYPLSALPHLYDDPISMKYDPSKPAPLTYAGVISPGNAGGTAIVYGAAYYHPNVGTQVLKKNLTTGATIQTITLPTTLTPYGHDRISILPDGLLVALDFDNGTFGIAKFYNLNTGTFLYTSTFARSAHAFVDTVNRNIWSIGLSDSKMRVYDFQPAPSQFSPFTVGTNRKRFRSDEITTTLKGSNGELIANWPVQWELNQAVPEGALDKLYTVTDELGVTTNRFYGPGVDDFLGQSTEIKAWTAY